MTIFTSRSPESYDPEPYVDATGRRYAHPSEFAVGTLDPRPEFEPTRDGFPWHEAGAPAFRRPHNSDTGTLVWAPRDRNRNRILIELRRATGGDQQGFFAEEVEAAYAVEGYYEALAATPAEIEHTRKVLTRLVNVYGVNA